MRADIPYVHTHADHRRSFARSDLVARIDHEGQIAVSHLLPLGSGTGRGETFRKSRQGRLADGDCLGHGLCRSGCLRIATAADQNDWHYQQGGPTCSHSHPSLGVRQTEPSTLRNRANWGRRPESIGFRSSLQGEAGELVPRQSARADLRTPCEPPAHPGGCGSRRPHPTPHCPMGRN